MAAVEDVRALGFLVPPEIVVLSPSEFANRVGLLMEEREDELRNDAMTLLFRLIGMLEAGDDLETLRRDLSGLPEIAWYDPGTASLLVADRPSGLGPLARSELFHEMVHALADQHYRWSDARAALLGAGADDRLAAFDALVEGDATYFQVVYIQQLPAGEREAIAREFVEQSPGSAEAPAWLLNDLAFPFDAGFDFVADLVAGGGIAAVDRAYLDPPTTSEHIVHPERFRRGETARVVGPPAASIDGYANLPAATFGEWGMRLLLEGSLSAGMLTQTVDGWVAIRTSCSSPEAGRWHSASSTSATRSSTPSRSPRRSSTSPRTCCDSETAFAPAGERFSSGTIARGCSSIVRERVSLS